MNQRRILYYKWSILYLILLVAVVVAGWFTTGYLGDLARNDILDHNEASSELLLTVLTDEIKRIAGGAESLSGSPWITPALVSGGAHNIARANSALDRYNSALGASVSYLLNNEGIAIASSNRNDADSFVGKSYRFRPYFSQAMRG